MSKHDKQVRRARKKRNRARRHRAVRRQTAALASAAALAAGTSAYAEPVRFDNPTGPGRFEWSVPGALTFLDITQSPTLQGGGAGLSSLYFYPDASGLVGNYGLTSPDVRRIGVILEPFAAGTPIDAAGAWAPYAFTDYPPNDPSLLPEGVNAYLGVRFDVGVGEQYGWIGVVRTGQELDVFAWGYETEPGVPIEAGAACESPICSSGCTSGGDMDDDGDVDADDIPLFVDALLGHALPPGTTDRSDLDGCGPGGDGDDVQAFVDKLLE